MVHIVCTVHIVGMGYMIHMVSPSNSWVRVGAGDPPPLLLPLQLMKVGVRVRDVNQVNYVNCVNHVNYVNHVTPYK